MPSETFLHHTIEDGACTDKGFIHGYQVGYKKYISIDWDRLGGVRTSLLAVLVDKLDDFWT